MSPSFAHEGNIDPRGDAPGGSLDDELSAEIADHLAAAAGELERRGAPEDEAATGALARFGDVRQIKRQCWWIHKGDEVMYRAAGITLLSLLTVGVVALALGGWQLQHSVSEQLETLSATQQALLAQQRPPQVAGALLPGRQIKASARRGGAGLPVFGRADREFGIRLHATRHGVVTRRLHTNARGRFDSGILQSGEYCLLAPVFMPDGTADSEEFPFPVCKAGR